jgi:signal transduction histidine kinase
MHMMSNRQPTSMTARIIILLVVTLSIVIAVSVATTYFLQRHELLTERNRHAESSVERLALTISAPLWNYDFDQMQQLAAEELKDSGPVRVIVYSADGKTFLSRDKNSDPALLARLSSEMLQKETFTVQHKIFKEQQYLGTLQVIYDDRPINRKLMGILVGNVIQGVALILIASITLYIGLSRALLTPLRAIFNAAQLFGRGDLSSRIASTSHDELGALAETFNAMASNIEEKISNLHDSIAEASRLRSWLSDIIDSLPSIIVGVDREGRVNLWNQQAEQFTGILSSNAMGLLAESLLPRFTPQLFNAIEVIDSKTPYRSEKIGLRDPDLRFFDVQIYPLASELGGHAVIRIDDVTEQARIEEIMMQTEKMMMVGGLAAGMAHEINNPLGAILQNAQNIERRISPDLSANIEAAQAVGVSLDDVHAYMEKRGILGFISHIREAGARASKIITNMLKFSRKSESHRETANLGEVLDQVLELAANDYDMKKSYDFRHIQVIREFDTTLPPITITILEIEQVLLNIIKNAAQAMSSANLRRDPILTLRTWRQGDMAVVEIEDNGPGMDERTQRRIFEPFFTTKEVGVGTGLGLSVSYAIITNNHKGHIEVVSLPGEGALFIIKLPIHGIKT